MNKLTEKELKEELEYVFSDYSFNLKIEEIESYWDDKKAWKVDITPKYEETSFEIHIEEIDGCFQFEYGEDSWEHLDDDNLFKWMFFEALTEIRNLKKSLPTTPKG